MKNAILLFLALTCIGSAQPFNVPHYHRAASSAAWYPLAIGDSLKYLFDPDTLGATRADGDTTYVWRNLARTDHRSQAYQTTASRKPLYRDSSGLRWLQFDVTDDRILTSTEDPAIVQPYTVYSVFKVVSTGSYPSLDDNASDASGCVTMYGDVPPFTLNVGTNPFASTGLAYRVDSMRVIEVTFNGASSSFRGASKSFVREMSGINLGTERMLGRTFGSLRFAVYKAAGNIYFYAVVSGTLSEADKTKMWNYLRTRFGI